MALDQVLLARVDQKVTNLDRNMEAHIAEDSQKFDRVFNFVKERFDTIENKIDDLMKDKVEPLWDNKNKQEGAFSLGRIVAGTVGGGLVAVLDLVTKGTHL